MLKLISFIRRHPDHVVRLRSLNSFEVWGLASPALKQWCEGKGLYFTALDSTLNNDTCFHFTLTESRSSMERDKTNLLRMMSHADQQLDDITTGLAEGLYIKADNADHESNVAEFNNIREALIECGLTGNRKSEYRLADDDKPVISRKVRLHRLFINMAQGVMGGGGGGGDGFPGDSMLKLHGEAGPDAVQPRYTRPDPEGRALRRAAMVERPIAAQVMQFNHPGVGDSSWRVTFQLDLHDCTVEALFTYCQVKDLRLKVSEHMRTMGGFATAIADAWERADLANMKALSMLPVWRRAAEAAIQDKFKQMLDDAQPF